MEVVKWLQTSKERSFASQMLNTPSSKVCCFLLTQPFQGAMSPLPLLSLYFPAHLGSGIEIPTPSKGRRVKVAWPFPGRLLLAPGPSPVSSPAQPWRRARRAGGGRKKDHSAEKEFGVKRTGERGGRRDRRVKWVQRKVRAHQSDCVY